METKQVIVVRTVYTRSDGTEFGLRKGKMIAQCAHAAMSFITRRVGRSMTVHGCTAEISFSKVECEWLDSSFAKICVRVNSLEELLEIKQKAEDAGLEVHLITDSGRTEFHGEPTETCLAIGPDYSERIDPITGDLKLL